MLVRETRLREGTAPREIGGVAIAPGKQRLVEDCFLLHTESGSRYFYQKGEGVIAEYSADWDPAEDSLWRNGSVYAAIACINGLYPIHASAVAVGGQVFAFTGPSSSGKSTPADLLGGLLSPDTGQVRIDDTDLAGAAGLAGQGRLCPAGPGADQRFDPR